MLFKLWWMVSRCQEQIHASNPTFSRSRKLHHSRLTWSKTKTQPGICLVKLQTLPSQMLNRALWPPPPVLTNHAPSLGTDAQSCVLLKTNKASWKMVNMFWITSMCVRKPRAVLPHMSHSHSSSSECFHNRTKSRAQAKTIKTQNNTMPKDEKREEEQEDCLCSSWHSGGSCTDSQIDFLTSATGETFTFFLLHLLFN